MFINYKNNLYSPNKSHNRHNNDDNLISYLLTNTMHIKNGYETLLMTCYQNHQLILTKKYR